MKNKKVLIAICIVFVLLVVITLITLFITNLCEDKKIVEENMIIINDNYNSLKNEVENYNKIRVDVTSFINNFYYDTIEEKYSNNLELLNQYDEVIGKITNIVKALDNKCNVIYSDSDVNTICNNYKSDYEVIVNIFINDLNNYNNKLVNYNNEEGKSLSLFNSKNINDYIDYNNDNKYEQKVVNNG